MKNFNRVPFDESKILFVVNNYCDGQMVKLDRSLGKSDGYISKLISASHKGKSNTMNYGDWLLIQKLYDVDVKMVEPVQKVEEDKQEETPVMDTRTLYKTIYAAVYDAMMMVMQNTGLSITKGE